MTNIFLLGSTSSGKASVKIDTSRDTNNGIDSFLSLIAVASFVLLVLIRHVQQIDFLMLANNFRSCIHLHSFCLCDLPY